MDSRRGTTGCYKLSDNFTSLLLSGIAWFAVYRTETWGFLQYSIHIFLIIYG
ncbi:hypothetical protein CI102_13485 [Trichoderma harzianum]|nr:hypothetical protein CI102_13485 [Trichoderma harzianum]